MNTQSLQDSLARWTGFPRLARTFEPRRTRIAAARVAMQLGDVKPKQPTPYDMRGLYERVMESWRRDRSLERVAFRDRRKLPWILFYPPLREGRIPERGPTGWLGAKPRIVQEYGRWLSDGHRPQSVTALLHEFLRVYPTDLPTFDDLRRLLQNAVDGSPSRPSVSLQRWRQRCQDSGLLESGGDRTFVQKLLVTTNPPDDILRQTGLDGGLARCRFLESGVRTHLPNISTLLAQNRFDLASLDKLLALLECDGKLRFDERDTRAEIASALLRPFVNRPPESESKERLKSFFLRHLGDPRLRSGRQRWSGAPDDVRNVVIRWLVKEALDGFFLLVKETALDRHWSHRETFWTAFLRQEVIYDAWFVLGSEASRLSMLQSDHGESETGALRGAQGNQSVLLLRMPGATVAEWSHDGACRIWLDGNPDAPKMYEKCYSRGQLMRGADLSQRHDGSDYGRWQDRVAEWMRDNTGVEIDRSNYILQDASL